MNFEEDKSHIYGLIPEMTLNQRPEYKELAELNKVRDQDLPIDYLNFISTHNGAEGDLGNNYLSIWSVRDVIDVALLQHEEQNFHNQFLMVASTGYFQYGIRDSTYFELDMFDETYSVEMGTNLTEFLIVFSQREWT